MFIKKNLKKMHANLNKYLVENCPALLGQNLISTCNRRVKPVLAGRVEISSNFTLGGDNMIPVNWYEILSRFAGIPAVL